MTFVRATAAVVLAWAALASLTWAGQQPDPPHPRQRARATARVRAAERPPEKIVWEVEGYGPDSETANDRALRNAHAKVDEFLHTLGFAADWQPTLDDVKHLVKDSSNVDVNKDDAEEFAILGNLRKVRLKVEMSTRDYGEFQIQERQFRSGTRMQELIKLLIGLVAVLASVAGYLRLEEATKGFYTAWLRLAAVAFAGALGAGFWFLG